MDSRKNYYIIGLILGLFLNLSSANARDFDLFGEPDHRIIYQLNTADQKTIDTILFSIGELVRTYGDSIHIVVTALGPGIHTLAKNPLRPLSLESRQRISSLANYGVDFHACGNTMKSLHWNKEDMLEFAVIIDVGVIDIMLHQERGYSYIKW
ncbi:MAG: hypothetical protein GXP22_11555 [Gammaproteobacteria bacterium]|nr:hypothetical protein [Gammaproteobacteria bacterium]